MTAAAYVTQGISRRGFLARAAMCGAASTTLAATPQIIDTHIHLYDPARPQGVPWPPKSDTLLYRPVLPETFTAMASPSGVTGAIVVEASPWLEDNQWVLDLAKDHPVIVGHVGHLDPGAADFRAHLARFAKNPLFRGIRLNSAAIEKGVAQPACLADLQRLADADLMLDAIGSATMIPALAALTRQVPKLRIAIDHMPAEPEGWRNSRAALFELARAPQVYCKVSGVLQRTAGTVSDQPAHYKAALDELWQAFGPDRVMYGSNWPVSDRLAPYATVFRVVQQYVSARGGGAADKFFRLNSQACYRWKNRG